MSMKEDVEEMKKIVKEAQQEEQSLAMTLLQDMKKTNKRMFIIWIITFISFLGLLGYTIWLLNDIEVTTTEEIIDIQDVETVDDSDIQIGDR